MAREIDRLAQQLFEADHPDKTFDDASSMAIRRYEVKALTHIINRSEMVSDTSERT